MPARLRELRAVRASSHVCHQRRHRRLRNGLERRSRTGSEHRVNRKSQQTHTKSTKQTTLLYVVE